MGLGTVAVFVLISFTVFIAELVRRHMKMRKLLSAIPSPRSLPLIGHVHLTKPDVEGFVDQIMGMANLFPESPRIVMFWFGTIWSVMIYSPVHIDQVVANSTHLNKGLFYDFLKPWLGCGLLTSGSVEWRPRRKLLTPTFHYDILKNFLHTFNNQSEILVQKFKNHLAAGEKIFKDIGHFVSLCALDIICETSMGQNVNAQFDKNSDYVRAVLHINDIIQRRQKNPLMWNNPIFWLFSDGREHGWALNVLHSFTKKVIYERRKKMLSDSTYLCETRLAFLDLLLEMEQNGDISANDIQEEVDTFMFEGHDTTATAITWVLQLLGNHPEMQQRIYEELQRVCGEEFTELTLDQLGQLKYLECFIKETLRLYPSVPIIARRLGADDNIGEYFVPKDTQVLINIYLIHRDPAHWPDPEVFNPERFFPENTKGRHAYAYIPFSAGSRNCIGQRFALMEEKTVLGHIVRDFRVVSLKRRDEMRHKTELILRPVGGVSVMLIPRRTSSTPPASVA